MKSYKVTIHEHLIYDMYVEAETIEEAEETAENAIIDEDSSTWQLDSNACWAEVGDITQAEEEDDDN
jgi:hypothetical protein